MSSDGAMGKETMETAEMRETRQRNARLLEAMLQAASAPVRKFPPFKYDPVYTHYFTEALGRREFTLSAQTVFQWLAGGARDLFPWAWTISYDAPAEARETLGMEPAAAPLPDMYALTVYTVPADAAEPSGVATAQTREECDAAYRQAQADDVPGRGVLWALCEADADQRYSRLVAWAYSNGELHCMALGERFFLKWRGRGEYIGTIGDCWALENGRARENANGASLYGGSAKFMFNELADDPAFLRKYLVDPEKISLRVHRAYAAVSPSCAMEVHASAAEYETSQYYLYYLLQLLQYRCRQVTNI